MNNPDNKNQNSQELKKKHPIFSLKLIKNNSDLLNGVKDNYNLISLIHNRIYCLLKENPEKILKEDLQNVFMENFEDISSISKFDDISNLEVSMDIFNKFNKNDCNLKQKDREYSYQKTIYSLSKELFHVRKLIENIKKNKNIGNIIFYVILI